MKGKFTIEALPVDDTFRVVINGKRVLEPKSTCFHDLVFFMITQALTYALDDSFDWFSRGGGTFYYEFIPDCYDKDCEEELRKI